MTDPCSLNLFPLMYCMKPLVTVPVETKQCTKHLTCDCTTCYGTRPVCKVSDLHYLWFFRYRVLNWTTTTTTSRRLFVLVMQLLPYFRYTYMSSIATILRLSLNWIFQMYGHDAGKPHTQYYRTLWYDVTHLGHILPYNLDNKQNIFKLSKIFES